MRFQEFTNFCQIPESGSRSLVMIYMIRYTVFQALLRAFCRFGDFESRQIGGSSFQVIYGLATRGVGPFWPKSAILAILGPGLGVRLVRGLFGQFKASRTRGEDGPDQNRQNLAIFGHFRSLDQGQVDPGPFGQNLTVLKSQNLVIFGRTVFRDRKSRLLKSRDFRRFRVGTSVGACGRRRFQI